MFTKHQTVNQCSGREPLFKLNRYLIEDTPNASNATRTHISSMNRTFFKKNIACSIDDELIELPSHFKYL